jgi:hypothetical protein
MATEVDTLIVAYHQSNQTHIHEKTCDASTTRIVMKNKHIYLEKGRTSEIKNQNRVYISTIEEAISQVVDADQRKSQSLQVCRLPIYNLIETGAGEVVEDQQVDSILRKSGQSILGSQFQNLVLDLLGGDLLLSQAKEVSCKASNVGSKHIGI